MGINSLNRLRYSLLTTDYASLTMAIYTFTKILRGNAFLSLTLSLN